MHVTDLDMVLMVLLGKEAMRLRSCTSIASVPMSSVPMSSYVFLFLRGVGEENNISVHTMTSVHTMKGQKDSNTHTR